MDINSLPDEATAYQTIKERVHDRIFFRKLASVGIVPQNENEAATLLTLSGYLRQPMAEKNAEDRFAPLLAQLHDSLGVTPQVQAQQKRAAAEEIAQQLMHDEAIYNSALTLKLAENLEAVQKFLEPKAAA